MKDSRKEYSKLDSIDRKVLLWLLRHAPQNVRNWVEYIAASYRAKSIRIDAAELCREIKIRQH